MPPAALTTYDTDRPPLRAFIYDRNSRILNGRSTSTADQDTENKRFCQRQGWSISATFVDPGRGASRHSRVSRPDFDEMCRRIEAGIRPGAPHAECDVLVVWAASRYARDLDVYVRLRDLCVRGSVLLCYNGRLYDLSKGDDRFATGLDALQAEREAENIRDGILRTTRANAERGRPHGRVPYGYRREYDPETGDLIAQVVYEPQAAVVREIAERIAGGTSTYAIARDLERRGVPGPTGGGWDEASLPALVLKPTNIGKRQHQGVIVGDAVWDPIFVGEQGEAVYYACVKILRDPGRRTQQDSAVKYLLSGIALCGPCQPERRVLRPQRVGARWSYTCTTCFRASIRTPVFDDVVTATVLAYVERPEFAAALCPAEAGGGGVGVALAEAAAYEQQLVEARALASQLGPDGRFRLSPVSLAALEAQLLPKIEAARARAQDASVPVVLRDLAGPRAREVWEGYGLVQRRAAIRSVVVVSLNRAGKGAKVVRPERFSWDWLR
jgi:site-specific DNA recombinase